MGIACDDSHTNFVLARFADADEAGAAHQALLDAGIIVRRVPGYGFPEGLRMTVGDAAQTGRLIAALQDWRGAA
jgi:histidinol-phosphate aminotransferase